MQIIPAIDVLGSFIVRLRNGDYNQVTYYDYNIYDLIQSIIDHDIKRLHIVNLSNAKSGKYEYAKLHKVLETFKDSIDIQVGGGIRTMHNVVDMKCKGASKVILGTAIIEHPTILNTIGNTPTIIGLDLLDYKLKINGWTEDSHMDLDFVVNMCLRKGYNEFLCTDISKDGTNTGPSIDLYKHLLEKYPDMKIIASGGVRDMDDIKILKEAGVDSVVVGKAFLENRITLNDIKNWNNA